MKIVRKSMLALLLAASVPMTGQAAGIVSTVTTASDDIVVSSNAEATVSATGRTDLISGSYPATFVLGNWSASVTAGTLAFRLARSINPEGSNGDFASYGYAVNSTDPSKRVYISLNGGAGSTTGHSDYRVLPQEISSITNGTIITDRNRGSQDLTPGSYPVGIEVAAYAF
ncbi:TPA: hypothetical protein ACF2D8_004673 [Serratia marcescens]